MGIGTGSPLGGGARKAMGVLLAAALSGLFQAPRAEASADEATSFSELRTRRQWTGWADARPVSPYLGGEFAEFTFGVPYSSSYLEGNPGRSGALSSYAYGSETGEALLELFVDGYQNPTLARSRFPDFGRDNREEVALAGDNGPRATAHAPTRTDADSDVLLGPSSHTIGAEGGFARTASHYNLDDLLTESSESAAKNVALPNGVRIGSVISKIKVENRLGQPPLITYRFALSDVEAGGSRIVGTGDDGIVLAGWRVPAADLARQFNGQLAQAGSPVQELAAVSLFVLSPSVEHEANDGYAVTGVVLELTRNNEAQFANWPLKGQPGGIAGVRLGYSRVFSQLLNFDH